MHINLIANCVCNNTAGLENSITTNTDAGYHVQQSACVIINMKWIHESTL